MGMIAIENAQLCDPAADAVTDGTLLIDGAVIAAVNPATIPADAQRIDAGGLVVAPGIIDLGVFKTDKPAFHFGGITRAALMPDTSPTLDDPGLVQHAGRGGKP
ncbi:MAG TPA: dihydroorotase, partial [Sphingobium sp.]